MRFWSHCMMVAPPLWPAKLVSVRSRDPLIYTVLSVEWPITVVRVFILRSADARVENPMTTTRRANVQRERRDTGGLRGKARTVLRRKRGQGNSNQTGQEYNGSRRSKSLLVWNRWELQKRFGCPSGIRTPICRSRGGCPTVERRGS